MAAVWRRSPFGSGPRLPEAEVWLKEGGKKRLGVEAVVLPPPPTRPLDQVRCTTNTPPYRRPLPTAGVLLRPFSPSDVASDVTSPLCAIRPISLRTLVSDDGGWSSFCTGEPLCYTL